MIPKTRILLMRRKSPDGIVIIQIPDMTNRLKAAEPTMVDGPRSPAQKPLPRISITDSRISGALVPRANRLRLATVSFHT